MRRIVIHGGFHKTGTTTVQAVAAQNAALLRPYANVYLRDAFRGLTEASRNYSIERGTLEREMVNLQAQDFFSRIEADDPRTIALLSEDLAGHLPGRNDIDDYSAVPDLMRQLKAACLSVWGDQIDLRFYFSTRAAAPWLRSAYWQILRTARRTESAEDFARVFAAAADFDDILARTREAVAPFPVCSMALEDLAGTPHGPMTPVLDLLDIPPDTRSALKTDMVANIKPEGLDEVFLALNRCGLSDRKVTNLKKTMMRMAHRLRRKKID